MRIGEALVGRGVVNARQVEQALEQQRLTGGLLGEILLSHGWIGEEDLHRALADVASVAFVRLGQAPPDAAALALVPPSFARDHLVVPLGTDGVILRVAQANPFDVLALDELQRMTGCTIEPQCATPSDVQRVIDRSYAGHGEIGELARIALGRLNQPQVDQSPSDSPIVKLIEVLLSDAITRGATDLHIEPEDREIRLRYRVDGVLTGGDTLPKDLHAPLVSRIKVLAGLDIAEQRLPQDGRITKIVRGRAVDLRIATFPTVFGEKVAVRVLEKEKLIRGLEDLGLSKRNLATFHDVLSKSRGIILVTGPTGAGKTTTLYSALSHLGAREKNIHTVEDPVEYEMPAIRQTQVRPKAGLTFATALRSVLRQDPDVIMVGEIRDPETAQLALRAALSGVLVFSTLHTQDSPGAVPRLMDMGLEPYLLSSAVVAVVAQRLLRLVCPDCRERASYPPETLAKAGLTSDQTVSLFRGRGCANCNGTGYRGRTGVFEVMLVDAAIHDLIRKRADSKLIKQAAMAGGMKTLFDDALAKAIFGITTLEEVLRIAYE
jgi:type IV pilus assembly protein PilB